MLSSINKYGVIAVYKAYGYTNYSAVAAGKGATFLAHPTRSDQRRPVSRHLSCCTQFLNVRS